MPPEALRYCGRLFSEQEMQLIRALIAEDPTRHRSALSRLVCERLDWRRANGQLKDMSCRVAMLRMHRDRLIRLPAPRRRHPNGTLHRRRTAQAEPELPIVARVDELPAVQVRRKRPPNRTLPNLNSRGMFVAGGTNDETRSWLLEPARSCMATQRSIEEGVLRAA